MDPIQGPPTEGTATDDGEAQGTQHATGGARSRRLAGSTVVLAAVLAVALVSGTAVAAVRLRDDRGAGHGRAAPATTTPTTTPAPPTTTPAPPTTTLLAPTTTTRPKPRPRPTPKLRPGDQSQTVLAVQRHLIELGYIDLAKASGRFDAATLQAVLAFQKVHGLGRDGVIGPATWRAVTPEGTFRIQRRINAWRKSDLGLLYRPAYFSGGYAYHGAFSVPAWPASHGCIRMSIATMDRVYDQLAVGTPVYVYRT